MKVIILAAGIGSRLGDANLPKPLTKLATGKSILEFMIENLSRYVTTDDIIVVVGHRKEMVMDAFPGLLFVYNSKFAEENTSKSLLRALNKVQEDVLWLNGDVVFHESILKEVFAMGKTGMVVNVGDVGDEEVKYRVDSLGKILEVSKQVKEPKGEALGINFFKAKDLEVLRRKLEQCGDRDYFEKGIELSIQEGLEVWSIPVRNTLCAEIDFPEDLERANRFIAGWNQKR